MDQVNSVPRDILSTLNMDQVNSVPRDILSALNMEQVNSVPRDILSTLNMDQVNTRDILSTLIMTSVTRKHGPFNSVPRDINITRSTVYHVIYYQHKHRTGQQCFT